MRNITSTIIIVVLLLFSCERITPEYPDEPVIDYQTFSLYITVDELNNKTLVGSFPLNSLTETEMLDCHPCRRTLLELTGPIQ